MLLQNLKSRVKIPKSVFLVIPFVLFLLIRLPGLGTDMLNSDGGRWHNRSIKFLEALWAREYKNTYQHYQPGVTLMWVASLNSKYTQNWLHLEDAGKFPSINRNVETELVLILSALFISQLYLISRIFNLRTALLFGLFISLEPYLAGIDRWVHLTSLETYFGFTGILLTALFVKNGKKIYLLAAPVFLALAVLSKLTSLLLVLFAFLMLVYKGVQKNNLRYFIAPLLLVAVFVSVFVALFPAMWVDAGFFTQKLYSAIFGAVATDLRGGYFYGVKALIYYPAVLLLRLSPVLVILSFLWVGWLALTLYFSALRKKIPTGTFWPPMLFLFLLVFMTISDKKIDRYLVVLLPPLFLSLAIFLDFLMKKGHSLKIYLGLTFYCLFCLLGLFSTFPAYSAYYSPVFGSGKLALESGFYENSGEYYADAAFYLNKKGRDVRAYVPHNIDAFKYFYKGVLASDEVSADYFVIGLDFDRKTIQPAVCRYPEAVFGPRLGMKGVFIFKCEKAL